MPLPGSYEAVLLLRLADPAAPSVRLVVIATAGNLLGSLLTDGTGRVGNLASHRSWLRIDEDDVRSAARWFARWGPPSLLFAWLPVLGDPLCLLAGLLRVGP